MGRACESHQLGTPGTGGTRFTWPTLLFCPSFALQPMHEQHLAGHALRGQFVGWDQRACDAGPPIRLERIIWWAGARKLTGPTLHPPYSRCTNSTSPDMHCVAKDDQVLVMSEKNHLRLRG